MLTAAEFEILARAQVGKPYVLGAEAAISNDDPPKFDCSELVEWLFGRNGTPIGDLAAAQYDKTKAATGDVLVGDLVFLRNNPARWNGIGHVAVIVGGSQGVKWLGDGRYQVLGEPVIIEARGRAYGVVKTTLAYWKQRKYFTGLRRFRGFTLAAPEPDTWENYSAPKPTGLNVTTYNCLDPRFGGKANDDAAVLRKAASSVYLLTEAPEIVRTNFRRGMSGGLARWLVWERVAQAIGFDKAKWQHTTSKSVVFGPTSYHGAVIAVLTRKSTGQQVQFACLHLPPKSVATEAKRKASLLKLIAALDPKLPTIIGGDFNTTSADEWAAAHGFVKAVTGVTTDKGHTLDYLLARGGVEWLSAEVLNPGAASDHRAVHAKARIPAASTS
jgi:hypothetical protein